MDYFRYCPWDGYRFLENDQQCFICKRPRYKIQTEQVQTTKKWKKILYQTQEFDDNYTDETFLSNVVTQNTSQNGPDFKELISKSSDLIFAINSVVLYLIMFYTLLHQSVKTSIFMYILSLVSVLGSVLYVLLTQKMFRVHDILSNIKSLGVVISLLLMFSPVMLTVNQTYANDTIYTLATVCVLFHLITRDYDYESNATPSSWTVNSSTFSSLCFSSLLASRLNDEMQAFVMLFTSLLLFVFAQFLKVQIKKHSNRSFKIFMISLSLFIFFILWFHSILLALLYVLGVFFITFISPLQIIWLYQYKKTIQGPWDLPDVKQYD